MNAFFQYTTCRLSVLNFVLVFVSSLTASAQWNINENSELYSTNPAVGIGITDPSAKLEIWGGIDNNLLSIRQNKNSGGSENVIFFRDDRGYAGNNTGTTFKVESWKGYGQQGGTLVNFTTIDNGFYKSRFSINNDNGFTGIGTPSPQSQLHLTSDVDHDFRISRTNGMYGFRISRDATRGIFYFQNTDDNNAWGTRIRIEEGGSTWKNLILNPDGGNVAIGTVDPRGYRLAVAGKAIAEEIVVQSTANWPDYVFDNEYDLPSLAEVERFVRLHRRLPDVPSADEVKENGLSVGEMNAILLRKVEELTLHLIEQEKEIDQLRSEIKDIKGSRK